MSDVDDAEIPPVGGLWQRPPSSDKGDATAEVIYQHVGLALSQWEHTESQFAKIFGAFLHAESTGAERVFGTLAGVHGRIAALQAAAEVVFRLRRVTDEDQAQWGRLAGHYRAAAERRNDIAHGTVVNIFYGDKEHGHFLMPAMHATKKRDLLWNAFQKEGLDKFGTVYRYTSSDIFSIVEKFGKLALWSMTFSGLFVVKYIAPH